MNANATVAAIAIKIVMVNAEAKRGEKVFNAYMLSSIRFNCCCCCCCCWLGSAVLFLLFCCQASRMGLIASSRYGCTIRTQKKSVKFFLNFFFSLGVGAWVGRWGRRDGDGRARDEAGWIGIVAVGWARIASCRSTNPNSDCRLGCDR